MTPHLGPNLGRPHLGDNVGHLHLGTNLGRPIWDIFGSQSVVPIWEPIKGAPSESQSWVLHLGANLGSHI